MKRKYYLIVFLISLGSCKKLLDTKPTDFLNPANYYQTETQLQYARFSVYNMLGTAPLYGSYALYLMGWEGDIAFMNRPTPISGPWNYFYTSADSYVAAYWNNLFQAINRANVVLANVDKNKEISQSIRDVIRGEMIFLRGYYYFMLVQYFGGVPLKITPTSSVIDVDIPRASVKEVYDQIVKDMETAEPLVPDISTLGYSGVVSKSAVRGILARVNLTMAGEPLKDKTRYAEASKWAKMVMDDVNAGHALNPSYPQIFINMAADKYDIKESIWEVEFFGNRSDQYVETGQNGYINGTYSNSPVTGVCGNFMSTTSKFYDIFEPGDNRKWWCIQSWLYTGTAAVPTPNGSKIMVALPANQGAKNLAMKPAKWRREYETVLPKTTATPENVPLLRYSDILLMYAEAENEINGPTPAAIDVVNQVRRRAWSTGVKTITVTNGGSGYTTAPTVTFSAGIGTGVVNNTAAGTATISGGKVTDITLNRDLTGVTFNQEGQYPSAPNITITGGGGTGANATATVFSKPDADLTSAQTSSKQNFLAAIQDERMREFNFESLRKADLLRWGIFLKVSQDMGNELGILNPGYFFVKMYSNVSSKDLLMPIPIVETSTNLKMVQNPGW